MLDLFCAFFSSFEFIYSKFNFDLNERWKQVLT
jgi:hypothetical protein